VTEPHTLGHQNLAFATAFQACSLLKNNIRLNKQAALESSNDARTGMPPGIPEGAICVQRFDDSRNSAIHITYRISLRSSSMPEPRDPLLKVLKKVALSRSDSKNLAEFGKDLGGHGPGNPKVSPAASRRAHQSNRLKVIKGGQVRGRSLFQGDPHGLLMILPQVHLRNSFS
jgi:hypothetical protein